MLVFSIKQHCCRVCVIYNNKRDVFIGSGEGWRPMGEGREMCEAEQTSDMQIKLDGWRANM